MQTIQLQPLSVLAGVGLAMAASATIGQPAAQEPGVLEVRELRVVDAEGAVLVRIGSSDRVNAGFWMLDGKGVERISMELEVYPDEAEDALGIQRLIMRSRSGKEVVQLGQHDGTHHGDVQKLNLGVDTRTDGVAIANHADGSRLSLGGEGGHIEMDFDYTGPYLHMRATPVELFGASWPDSHIHFGRQNLTGGTDGSLRATFMHGSGVARLSIDPDGQPRLRMINAENEVIAPEPR